MIVNGSNTAADTAICSSAPMRLDSFPNRCGYSQRLPLIVISPYTRSNFVSNRLTNTVSVTRFIEDNWLGGQRIAGSFDAISGSLAGPRGVLNFNKKPHFGLVILDPTTGAVVSS